RRPRGERSGGLVAGLPGVRESEFVRLERRCVPSMSPRDLRSPLVRDEKSDPVAGRLERRQRLLDDRPQVLRGAFSDRAPPPPRVAPPAWLGASAPPRRGTFGQCVGPPNRVANSAHPHERLTEFELEDEVGSVRR